MHAYTADREYAQTHCEVFNSGRLAAGPMARPHFLEPLLDDAPESYCVRLNREAPIVASTIETAFDSQTRNRGLLGRDQLPEGTVLVLAPCNSVHTWNMRFPIDILFARRDGGIAKIKKNVQPWRIAIAWRAFATIECPAGTIERCGVRPDDRLIVEKMVFGK